MSRSTYVPPSHAQLMGEMKYKSPDLNLTFEGFYLQCDVEHHLKMVISLETIVLVHQCEEQKPRFSFSDTSNGPQSIIAFHKAGLVEILSFDYFLVSGFG